ncbi:MAG: FMN-binding protein [Atopobiaceae bacterium]|nr:FMN-binding protein [Atopobiaceae bacterium]
MGYVIVAQSKGYGGQVPIAVAFDTSGNVTSITTMPNEETPGLGSRIAEESYIGQYVGLAASPISADDIDLISGATISSKAALSAFNIAVEAYEEVC